MLSNLSYLSATHIEQHNHIRSKKQTGKKHFFVKQYKILTLLPVLYLSTKDLKIKKP